MQRGVTLSLRRLALLGLLAAGLCSGGCVPSVGWLPDSSGIVYTGGKDFNQLLLYDLKKGKQQVLVADTGANTLWPAISPDGSRIAVAKLIIEPKQKQTRLQVILYDRRGKEIERSKTFDWLLLDDDPPAQPNSGNDTATLPQLFWAPGNQGDRILVHTAGFTGIYDVKSQKLIHAGEGVLLIFRGGPVRPDGAGFLVMKNPKGWATNFNDKQAKDLDPRFAFVDWNGKEKPLKAPPLMLDQAALKTEKDSNKLMALFNPHLFDSGWEEDVARVSYNGDRLRYFTRKGEAVLDQAKPEMTAEGLVWCQYSFPGGPNFGSSL